MVILGPQVFSVKHRLAGESGWSGLGRKPLANAYTLGSMIFRLGESSGPWLDNRWFCKSVTVEQPFPFL